MLRKTDGELFPFTESRNLFYRFMSNVFSYYYLHSNPFFVSDNKSDPIRIMATHRMCAIFPFLAFLSVLASTLQPKKYKTSRSCKDLL